MPRLCASLAALLLLPPFSSAAVSPEPAPDIAAAGPVKPEGEPGLLLLRAVEPSAEYSIKLVNVIHVLPAAYELRAVLARTVLGKNRATLPEIMAAVPEAMAGMNASFFSLEDGKLVGFFMEGGRIAEHHPHPSMDRIFFSRADGTAGIAAGTRIDPQGVLSAVSGKSAWDEQSASARTALCIDEGGHVKLVSAYPVRDLSRMTEYLTRREACAAVVHLDGGGSAQAFVRGKLSVGWERGRGCERSVLESPSECFRPVPAFILAVPRT